MSNDNSSVRSVSDVAADLLSAFTAHASEQDSDAIEMARSRAGQAPCRSTCALWKRLYGGLAVATCDTVHWPPTAKLRRSPTANADGRHLQVDLGTDAAITQLRV